MSQKQTNQMLEKTYNRESYTAYHIEDAPGITTVEVGMFLLALTMNLPCHPEISLLGISQTTENPI